MLACVQIIWCSKCDCAISWSLMTNAESPKSLFDLLYCYFPDGAKRIVYDNGCNFLAYILNRAPGWAKQVQVFIDTLHKKGHVKGADGLDTGVVLKASFKLALRCTLERAHVSRPPACMHAASSISIGAEMTAKASALPAVTSEWMLVFFLWHMHEWAALCCAWRAATVHQLFHLQLFSLHHILHNFVRCHILTRYKCIPLDMCIV
jgi:hypothetical protein